MFLGLLSAFLFLFGTWALFSNPMHRMNSWLLATKKKTESGTDDEKAEANVMLVGGCLVTVMFLFFAVGTMFLELVMILAALTGEVGIPELGYVALAAWFLSLAIGVLVNRSEAKKLTRSKAEGREYEASKIPIIFRLVGYLPNLYAGYLLLVVIGVVQ